MRGVSSQQRTEIIGPAGWLAGWPWAEPPVMRAGTVCAATMCKQLGWAVRGDYVHHRLHDLSHAFIVRSELRMQAGRGHRAGTAGAVDLCGRCQGCRHLLVSHRHS